MLSAPLELCGLTLGGKDGDRPSFRRILYRDPCAYCGRRGRRRRPGRADQNHPRNMEVDHIDPRCQGGAKGIAFNGTAACVGCNRAKGSKPLLLFLLERLA